MKTKINLEYLYLILISFIYFIFLFYRNSNLFPSVMGDEFVHSQFAKHYSFEEMTIPTYLYYFIFSFAKSCGQDYFNCARIMNSIFFFFGNFLIFLIANRYINKLQSLIIFSLILFSPLNSYTAYFTAEATYFFFIWLFIFCYVFLDKSKYKNNLILGFVLGLCSLIKPHALILFIGIIINNFCLRKNIKNFKLNLIIFILTFLVIKILPSLFLSGKTNIVGFYYLNSFRKFISYDILEISKKSLINFFGIFAYLIILFGIPLIISFEKLVYYLKFNKEDKLTELSIFAFIIICVTIIILSLNNGFEVHFLENQISYENPKRLNIRYFFFYFPLFFLLGFFYYNNQNQKFNNNKSSRLFKALIILFIIIAIYFSFNKYPSYHLVDGPLYRGITYNDYFFGFLIFFLIIIFSISIKNVNLSLKIYLFIYLPFIMLPTSSPITKEILYYKSPTIYDNYANIIKKNINKKNFNQLILIHFNHNNSDEINEFKILLKLDHKEIYLIKPKNLNFQIPKKNMENELINIIKNETWYWHFKNDRKFDLYIILKNENETKKIYIFDPKNNSFEEIL